MLEILKSKTMILFVVIVFGLTYIGGMSDTRVQSFESNENIQIVVE